MSRIREIFEKLFNGTGGQAQHPRLTSEEVELASFKERERLDNIKKDLAKYRLKNYNELIFGKKIDTGNILNTKNPLIPKQAIKRLPKIPKNMFLK